MMWKKNWLETKARFNRWWQGQGFLIGQWTSSIPSLVPHDRLKNLPECKTIEQYYVDVSYRIEKNHNQLAVLDYPFDILPISDVDLGPGSLALYLGSEPEFAPDTIWYHPLQNFDLETTQLEWNENQKWWQIQKNLLEMAVKRANGRYFVGCPDLAEGLDILASLMGTEKLLTTMVDHPTEIYRLQEQLLEIYKKVFEKIYRIICCQDQSMTYRAFCLWGQGKTAKLQCDTAAMIPPSMFRHFVVPFLEEQCRWLDYTMFHLDGTQSLCHLDTLLQIESLKAIEWTPQFGIPDGADPCWFEMYRHILRSGKSLQIVNIPVQKIPAILDAIGTDGVYILADFRSRQDCLDLSNELGINEKILIF